jgi:DNA-binding LytR/AlgR family response regulator
MRVLILEDEPLAARRLERLTREVLAGELNALHAATTLEAAAAQLDGNDDTVLLLDLNLGAGADGFELLRAAAAEPCSTIVVSGSVERALEAFELGVVDFVAKPFTAERLALAFRRARERRGSERTRFLAVAYAGSVELVPLEQVIAIHGDDDYTSVELLDGRRRLHKRSLTGLEALLPPDFLRVHRSHLVNLVHARGLAGGVAGGRSLRLSNGSSVPVGRAYRARLEARLV